MTSRGRVRNVINIRLQLIDQGSCGSHSSSASLKCPRYRRCQAQTQYTARSHRTQRLSANLQKQTTSISRHFEPSLRISLGAVEREAEVAVAFEVDDAHDAFPCVMMTPVQILSAIACCLKGRDQRLGASWQPLSASGRRRARWRR